MMYNGWLSFLSMCGRVHHDDKPFLLCCLSKWEEIMLPLVYHQTHPSTRWVILAVAHQVGMDNLFPASLYPGTGKCELSTWRFGESRNNSILKTSVFPHISIHSHSPHSLCLVSTLQCVLNLSSLATKEVWLVEWMNVGHQLTFPMMSMSSFREAGSWTRESV